MPQSSILLEKHNQDMELEIELRSIVLPSLGVSILTFQKRPKKTREKKMIVKRSLSSAIPSRQPQTSVILHLIKQDLIFFSFSFNNLTAKSHFYISDVCLFHKTKVISRGVTSAKHVWQNYNCLSPPSL